MVLHEIFRVVSRFPCYISFISRKIDFIWDSAQVLYLARGIRSKRASGWSLVNLLL